MSKGTKVRINDDAFPPNSILAHFNGKKAAADGIEGKSGDTELVSITGGWGVFLSADQFVAV